MSRRERPWVIYVCGPIDWWEGWWRLTEYDYGGDSVVHRRKAIMEEVATGLAAVYHRHEDRQVLTVELLLQYQSVRHGFGHAGWEGDGSWYFAVLPDPQEFGSQPIFAAKQSNNGTTFIASRYKLPWLGDPALIWLADDAECFVPSDV
tara:strand:- start:2954 stop:3397 length:444 start_codon:yes stop_codon:yes gene_type:complete